MTVRSTIRLKPSDHDRPQIRESGILRLPQVIDSVLLSESTIFRMVKDHQFPAPIRLGKRAIAWHKSDITEWLSQRTSARADASLTADAKEGQHG